MSAEPTNLHSLHVYQLLLSKRPCKIITQASILLPLPLRTSMGAIRSRATSIHGLPLPWTKQIQLLYQSYILIIYAHQPLQALNCTLNACCTPTTASANKG